MFRRGTSTKRPRFTVGGHTVFEPDDSSNHSGLGLVDYEDDSLSQHHNTSANSSDPNSFFGQFAPDRPRRAQKSITKMPMDDNTNLNACLDHLFRTLSRKDKEGFFQFPVTDQIAPGYSQIIARPMDFSTMKRKIQQDEYSNILEFRSDFELMCDNAMKYNRPDTIYWQAAKKLLATGSKLMNKEKLISSRRSLECFARLTERELGFRIDSSNHSTDEPISSSNEQFDSSNHDSDQLSSISLSQACSQRKPKLILKLPKFYDKAPTVVPDEPEVEPVEEDEEEEEELPPEEILAQAQQAAQCARDKLNSRQSIFVYSLDYQRGTNSTTLHYTNQDDDSEQTVKINECNENNSTSLLPIVNENDKRNQLLAKHFLENGPFSSNASQYDSPFSSTSKEELDQLIHTYGSEFSAQYAVSLMDYVKQAGDLALAYVDRFLSVLTNGEHDNFMMKKREKQPKKELTDSTIENVSADTPPSDNSMSMTSSNQIKLEPQLQIDNNNLQHGNDSMNDFDLAEKAFFNFNDLNHMSNGPEQSSTSESVDHHHGVLNDIQSPFDTL